MKTDYRSFAEFYPFYLGEHQNTISRRLHVIGTSLVCVIFLSALFSNHFQLLWLLPLVGYSFAWVGHYVFEKNRPATFQYPLYSLMGDFTMAWQVISRQIAW